MASMIRTILAGWAAGLLFALAGPASAQDCCAPPPPVCCAPPTPPCCTPPPPPVTPPERCCENTNTTHVHVNVSSVNVAIANAGARASAGAGAAVYYGGGGGGGGYLPPMSTGMIQGLKVDMGARVRRSAYEATRTRTRRVVIQAVCLDDRTIPHPASQTSPDREVEDGFDGEIYRCIAGAWLQATIADFKDHIDFSGGRTITCGKGEALRHAPGGKLACAPQVPARDCNERSLLRRFGAGVKILTLEETERYSAVREEEETSESAVATSFSLDGGVGGIVY